MEYTTDKSTKLLNNFCPQDIRMVTTAASVKLSKLVRKIQKEFDEQGPISLKYVDQDGDLVSLVRTSDLKTAIRLHDILNSTTIKLHLFSLDSRGSGGSQLPSDDKRDVDSSRSITSSPSASAATVDGFNSVSYLWHVPHAELEFKNVLGKVCKNHFSFTFAWKWSERLGSYRATLERLDGLSSEEQS